MKISNFSVAPAILALAFVSFMATQPVHADTYQIYGLGEGHRANVIGIEDSGAAVIWTAGDCGELYAGCYTTYVNGVAVSHSPVAPSVVYDNGEGCIIPVSPELDTTLGTISGFCNNGHEVYGTDVYTPAPYAAKIFDGYDLASHLVFNGTLDYAYINSSGDFIFYTGIGMVGYDADGYIFEAIDLTPTAEPSSLLLLGTGSLVAFWSVRRRLFSAR